MGSIPQSSKLFEPLKIGNVTLDHRIVMAPLTRFRNSDEHIILPMAQEYYEQRACVPGTLIISEAAVISKRASGYANTPGIWNKEQIAAWKAVVDRVHKSGSYIYLQLWALGRVADPAIKQKEGTGDVVSSSPTPYQEGAAVPRALTEAEIHQYIRDYASAAEAGVHEAGFDGVEIHAANGYLIDQFIQDTCNKRTDKWGGSIENRARFALEVTKAVVQAVGPEKTAIRLSPFSTFQGMKMQDPVPQFNYIVSKLKDFKLSYLHLVESRVTSNEDVEASIEKLDPFIKTYRNVSPVLLASRFTPASAKSAVNKEYKDCKVGIVFRRFFISNPDLVYRRVKEGMIELRMYERDTFYTPKQAKGYIDWPFSEEFVKETGRPQLEVR
ncbi:uncharacterized protein MYCFIDRAFT_148436 [Pseudocercospora fijiensis CIRAD86]|uniref:NADH:flavin oxidoreductase/NADH oxidase N-terminal domain-containing protein n=1 Tax=Pseudocercospora fijiensis (strain CIRAD86) TaxID=383855 RepID=N1QAA1_PSEFD|nr:uncharacterized protein MYCFIDRAFT_148436 [Pseudocercospora fijiensis CIRAD86]EME87822.1 hypothetical protein MYCFIDRAFT_148436 [Pseudocercospora fijiensis CIRAD86]